jgi:hypothetical protein
MSIKVKINQAGMRNLEEEVRRKLQPQFDAELQSVLRSVNERYRLHPVEEVYDAAVRELTAAMPNLVINPDNLRKVAEEISAGTAK